MQFSEAVVLEDIKRLELQAAQTAGALAYCRNLLAYMRKEEPQPQPDGGPDPKVGTPPAQP